MNAVDSNEVTPVQKMNNVDSEKKTNDVTPVNASIIDTNTILLELDEREATPF